MQKWFYPVLLGVLCGMTTSYAQATDLSRLLNSSRPEQIGTDRSRYISAAPIQQLIGKKYELIGKKGGLKFVNQQEIWIYNGQLLYGAVANSYQLYGSGNSQRLTIKGKNGLDGIDYETTFAIKFRNKTLTLKEVKSGQVLTYKEVPRFSWEEPGPVSEYKAKLYVFFMGNMQLQHYIRNKQPVSLAEIYEFRAPEPDVAFHSFYVVTKQTNQKGRNLQVMNAGLAKKPGLKSYFQLTAFPGTSPRGAIGDDLFCEASQFYKTPPAIPPTFQCPQGSITVKYDSKP